nr:MAG TPA: hypothetical protein [Caudoviricetes sp.]
MAIQSRRGAYGDFDPSKMLPGEWASVLKDDPNAQDGKAVYMCFSAGNVKRMATYEDMKNNIQEATAEIIKQAKEEVTEDTKAAKESAAQAELSAKSAEEKASAAEKSASNAEKAAESSNTALESANKNFSDQYTKKTYKKGETCIRDNALYEAKQEIDPAEDWNAAHWTETSVEKIRAKMRQELDTVNTNIANITPDDTAVDGKPWTSKHIVDMLCPPLKVSGNPVQCYPVPGYPLGITASWEPTQEGTGNPSPDNIRPIKGRDSVSFNRYGCNLITTPYRDGSKNQNGVQFTLNDDGSVSVKGTAAEDVFFNLSYNNPLRKFIEKGVYNAQDAPKTVGVFTISGCVLQITEERAITYIYVAKGKTIDTTYYPIILVGSAVPEVVPGPSEYNDTTLTLPETIYGGSVDAVSGEGQNEWKYVTLTGKEGIVLDGDCFRFPDYNSTSSDVICNQWIGEKTWGLNALFTSKISLNVGKNVCGCDTIKQLQDLLTNQYAAGTPVQFAYKLTEPTSFSATGNAPVKALSGVNTVLTDADSVEVTGREDLIHVIAGQ